MRKKIFLVMLFSVLLFFWPTKAQADSQDVLLVYDSLNIGEEKAENVDGLQRLLTSLGMAVTSYSMDDYQEGILTDRNFSAVITFINWPEKGLTNNHFMEDRKNFSGKKLHIGENIAEDESVLFEGSFQQLSHRQYTLTEKDGFFQEFLPYQDQSLLLQTDSGTKIGHLTTQEVEPQTYPFGVIQGNNAFLPVFNLDGGIFLEGADTIKTWLGKSESYQPLLIFDSFTPFNNLTVAKEFTEKINYSDVEYILSTTSTTENISNRAFKRFTNFLGSVQENNHIFLSVPAVNQVDTGDSRILKETLPQEISVLVSQNIYPVGMSAPGYFNYDSQYQADALSLAETLLLEPNPTDEPSYRQQTHQGTTFDTGIFSWRASNLDNVEWLKASSDYQFPLPLGVSYSFPENQTQLKKTMEKLKQLNVSFQSDDHYRYQIQTQTQMLTYKNGRIYLNDNPVNRLAQVADTQSATTTTMGLFSNTFDLVNNILIGMIAVTGLILTILFIRGRRNYRAKYLRKDQKNDHH